MRQMHSVLPLPVSWLEFWKDAGAENVIERQLNFQIEAPISFEQFWQLRTEMSETLREKMAGLTPDQLPAIKQAVADAAERYFMRGNNEFPRRGINC